MSRCRMVVSTIGMPGRYDLVGTRYYEVLALGESLLLVQRDRERDSGAETAGVSASSTLAYSGVLRHVFQENRTVGMFSSISEFVALALHYKERRQEHAVRSMIERGKALVANHTWDVRSNQIIQALQVYHLQRQYSCK